MVNKPERKAGLSTGHVSRYTLLRTCVQCICDQEVDHTIRPARNNTQCKFSGDAKSMIRLTQKRLFVSLISSKWGLLRWAHRTQYHKPSRPQYMATRWIWDAWGKSASFISTYNQMVGQYKQLNLKSTECEKARTCQCCVVQHGMCIHTPWSSMLFHEVVRSLSALEEPVTYQSRVLCPKMTMSVHIFRPEGSDTSSPAWAVLRKYYVRVQSRPYSCLKEIMTLTMTNGKTRMPQTMRQKVSPPRLQDRLQVHKTYCCIYERRRNFSAEIQ